MDPTAPASRTPASMPADGPSWLDRVERWAGVSAMAVVMVAGLAAVLA